MPFRNPTPSGRPPADISALADGSIAPDRREQIERQIGASDELRSIFEQELAAVGILRQARERDRAPDSLRRRIAQERAARSGRRSGSPRALVSGVAAATAVAAAAALLLLTAGPATGPSVAQAASLATRGADLSGPRADPDHPGALLQGVGEVYFPNWSRTLGWSAVGQRVDRLGRHQAVTVYYARNSLDIAYTIVSVPALDEPRAVVVTNRGLRMRVLTLAGRRVVTWRREGRTCILSSQNVSAPQLEGLAARS